jgi:hypothetical protein
MILVRRIPVSPPFGGMIVILKIKDFYNPQLSRKEFFSIPLPRYK